MAKSYNYTLVNKTFIYSKEQKKALSDNPPATKEDWTNDIYEFIKTDIKRQYLLDQNDRCCYCRTSIEPDGNYEPLEHIVAKSDKPEWMFEPRNLAASCDPCNNPKNAINVLVDNYNSPKFPNNSNQFKIFNPHFDSWGDHFKIENEIFLVCKNTEKAKFTYKHCHLWRYSIPIKFAKENSITHKDSMKKIAHKLYDVKVNSETFNDLIKAIEYCEKRI